MTAAEQEWPEIDWPAHWSTVHDHPHDRLDCPRCQREADHIEAHLGCYCIDHRWLRKDVGTPAVPRLVWCCGSCRAVMGPAYSGPTP